MTFADADDVVTGQPDTRALEPGSAGGDDTRPPGSAGGDDTRPLDEPLYVGPIENPDEYRLVGVPEGTGGQGQVWKGEYLSEHVRHEVAVKILLAPSSAPADWPSDAEVARWRDEVSLLSQVQHPHVVRYHKLFAGWDPHKAGTRRGEPTPKELRWYVLTEFIEGYALSTLVGDGKLRLSQRLAHIKELALAVNHLHTVIPGRALLHCDIKPSNARISPARGLVLVDFGLVELERPDLGAQRVGSGPYMAPEVLDGGEPPSVESDKWAVAATAFEVLTGERPNPRRLDWMHGRLRDKVGSALADRVVAMLGPKGQRQSIDLVAWADSLMAVQPESTRPPRRPLVLILAGAALLAIVGAFLLGRAGSPDPRPPPPDESVPARDPSNPPAPTASNYIGRPIAQVRPELDALGVPVQITDREILDPPPGMVIDQSVPPASTLARGITLTVTKAPSSVAIEEVVLTVDGKKEDLGIFGNSWSTGSMTIDGQSWSKGIFVEPKVVITEPAKEYNASFVLSRRYHRFVARAGVLDNSANEGPFRVRVTGDTSDRILLEQNVRLGQPLDINLDVSGLSRLTVTFVVPGPAGGRSVGVGEAKGIPVS
jgi:serine/threonine protein kinase